MRFELVEKLKDFLKRKGYRLFEYLRGCFDLAAKREKLLLLKVLSNVDSFQPSQARDLKILSKSLSASPLIIGERTRRKNLEKDVVYERFGLPTLHPETFKSAVEGKFPSKIRTRGGIFGRIDPEALRKIRKEKGLTQEELAGKLSVSQKNISEHERESKRANYSLIKWAEEVLDRKVKERINPFQVELEEGHGGKVKKRVQSIAEYMEKVGFKINYTSRAPPELIAKERTTLLSRFGTDEKILKKWESHLSKFSELSGSPAFLIFEDKYELEKLPVFSKDELQEIEDSKELINMVKEKEAH